MRVPARLVLEGVEDAEVGRSHANGIPGDRAGLLLHQGQRAFQKLLHLLLFARLGLHVRVDRSFDHNPPRCFDSVARRADAGTRSRRGRCVTIGYTVVSMSSRFDDAAMAEGYARSRPPLHARIVDRIPDRPATAILDLGCGAGLSTAPLTRRASLVVGIDPFADMVRWGSRTAP